MVGAHKEDNVSKTKIYIASLFLLVASSTLAQVKFEAKVSKSTLGVNERLRIDFQMNEDGDNFTPPSFENFKVVMGPNQSISNSWINGKRSFSKTYSYILTPTRKGKFKIKQATVEINGQVFKTTPIDLVVTSAVEVPKDPNDPSYIADQNLHLVAEVSKGNPYLNEDITVVYKLYFGPTVNVTNFSEVDRPSYDGFWSHDMKVTRYEIKQDTYKGQPYNSIVIARKVLYPQKSTKLKIEPLVLDVSVEVPTNRRDFFGGRIYKNVQKKVSAGRRTINVKPLPEHGRPIDFTGAVGDFALEVSASKDALKAGESLQAKVRVKGKGNLKLFDLPKLNVPSSLEVYDPERDNSIRTNLSGMQGSITDSYTVVPQYQGKYPIPPINFSYFNPDTETYETITSPEVLINVTEGPTNADAIVSNNTSDTNISAGKQAVLSTGSQFRFLKLRPNLQPKNVSQFFGSKAYYGALLLPLLLIPLAIIVRKKKSARNADVEGNRLRKASRLAKKYLSEAKKNLGKKEAFYESMERALHNYLKAKLNIETSEFSKPKIRELLTERGVSEVPIDQFIAILENCELARYTPATVATMKQDYNQAAQTISDIDKQIK